VGAIIAVTWEQLLLPARKMPEKMAKSGSNYCSQGHELGLALGVGQEYIGCRFISVDMIIGMNDCLDGLWRGQNGSIFFW